MSHGENEQFKIVNLAPNDYSPQCIRFSPKGTVLTCFECASSRNPVLNLVSMFGLSYIPDWVLCECAIDTEFSEQCLSKPLSLTAMQTEIQFCLNEIVGNGSNIDSIWR